MHTSCVKASLTLAHRFAHNSPPVREKKLATPSSPQPFRHLPEVPFRIAQVDCVLSSFVVSDCIAPFLPYCLRLTSFL